MKLLNFTISVQRDGETRKIFNRFLDVEAHGFRTLAEVRSNTSGFTVSIGGTEIRPILHAGESITFKLEDPK